MQTKYNRFKELKFKKWKKKKAKKKKENSTELQKLNVEAEVYNNSGKNMTEGKRKLKCLIRLHSANKIDYTKGGKKEKI